MALIRRTAVCTFRPRSIAPETNAKRGKLAGDYRVAALRNGKIMLLAAESDIARSISARLARAVYYERRS